MARAVRRDDCSRKAPGRGAPRSGSDCRISPRVAAWPALSGGAPTFLSWGRLTLTKGQEAPRDREPRGVQEQSGNTTSASGFACAETGPICKAAANAGRDIRRAVRTVLFVQVPRCAWSPRYYIWVWCCRRAHGALTSPFRRGAAGRAREP